MLTGYSATLPTDVLVNMGVLFYSKSGVATKIGVTEGAPDFDPGIEISDITFDGQRCRLKGLSRKTGFKPIIKPTLKEFGPTASGGQIALLEPGETEALPDGTGTKLITPKAAGVLFAATDYVTNLRWIFERASGGYAAIYFPIGLCTKWSLKGNDKKESAIAAEFEAIGDPTADLATAPYLIEIRTALPTT